MNSSTPDFPVLCHLQELTQTHVHWVGDAIQPSHSQSSPSLSAFFLSIRIFSNELALCIWWHKYWSFSFSISPSNEYSELISFKTDKFDPLAVKDSPESSPEPQFKSISSLALSLLYGPTLMFVCDNSPWTSLKRPWATVLLSLSTTYPVSGYLSHVIKEACHSV